MTSQNAPGSVLSIVIRTFMYCLLAGGTTGILIHTAASLPPGETFNEYSVIEWVQLLYLVICAVLFYLCTKAKNPAYSLSVLLTGLAVLATVREMDFFLDNYLFDGAWQVIATAVAMLTAVVVFRNRQGLKSCILAFSSRASFGYMVSAFVSLVVFSRLIGMKVVWQSIMAENFMRAVKSFVEEGTELFAYALLLIAAIEYFRESR